MKILVTGGCGFVGGHLCELLVEKGHEVTALDDLSTGSLNNVKELFKCSNCLSVRLKEGMIERLARKREIQGRSFTFIKGSVLNAKLVDRLVKKVDAVFHLASVVGVKLVIDEPVKTIETIADGTSCVLRACRKYMKKVLVTSTSEVYGKGIRVPFTEDDDTVLGATSIRRWAYSNAKAMDEFLALAHYHEAKLPVVVVRLFNTVGPRQTGQYGMVVPRFVKAALEGRDITVYDNGRQSRCFCHVLDVVKALEKLLLKTPKAFGQVINIGNPTEISMNGLAKAVKAQLKSSSKIIHISYEQAYNDGGFEDMRRRVPSIEKAKRMIGFQPRKTLKDIIEDVAESIKRGE